MKPRARLLLASALAVATLSACNAILGITDLHDPGAPDGGGASADAAETSTDAAPIDSSPPDTSLPDASACGSPGEADPCITVVQPLDGGSLFPTWTITSDLLIQDTNVAKIQPTPPVYADAGAGTVTETHSQLTWQTAHNAGGVAVDYAGAVAACQALADGPWRVPTRIELATTQYRNVATTEDAGPTSCVPDKFVLEEAPRLWTSTQVPGASNTGANYAPTEAPGCGFFGAARTSAASVRCVKGDAKAATFLVSKKADTVLAVDTQLEWERTGAIVKGYASAKAHCDGIGWRLPVIQELYGIIDTRTSSLFLPGMFAQPAGAAPRAILSQTVAFYGGAAPYYWAVALIDAPFGAEDSASDDDGVANLLVRCVRKH